MTIDEAIEILDDLYKCPHMKNMDTQNRAIELGIEALNRIKNQRIRGKEHLLLNGETN